MYKPSNSKSILYSKADQHVGLQHVKSLQHCILLSVCWLGRKLQCTILCISVRWEPISC